MKEEGSDRHIPGYSPSKSRRTRYYELPAGDYPSRQLARQTRQGFNFAATETGRSEPGTGRKDDDGGKQGRATVAFSKEEQGPFGRADELTVALACVQPADRLGTLAVVIRLKTIARGSRPASQPTYLESGTRAALICK